MKDNTLNNKHKTKKGAVKLTKKEVANPHNRKLKQNRPINKNL